MTTHESTDEPRSWKNYLPLITVVLLSALVAVALQKTSLPDLKAKAFAHDFMGMFLFMFSLFKLINVPGFADGFSMYDLLASRFRPYGLIYPFLELALSLAYLNRFALEVTYLVTVGLMGFGALGVFHALRKDMKINCACLGTVLNVPLSTVAVVEDLGMAGMALVMFLFR